MTPMAIPGVDQKPTPGQLRNAAAWDFFIYRIFDKNDLKLYNIRTERREAVQNNIGGPLM